MQPELCPACAATDSQRNLHVTDLFFGSLDEFTYIRCLECGHVRLCMDSHVGGGEFGRGAFGKSESSVVLGVMDHPALSWGYYHPRSQWIARRVGLTPAHSVLDVGAGSGRFLSLLRRRFGCACSGLDLDPAYSAGAPVDGIRRLIADFTHFETDERFDLITMFHLIEHLDNPAPAIQKAWKLLKPGGFLYIETPAADSLAFTVFGPFWLPLFPPYHRHVFSRRSLLHTVRCNFAAGDGSKHSGVYVPGEIIVSTWLWFARYSPHPFRRTRVRSAVKLAALAGMTATSLLAAPVEVAVMATAPLVDAISGNRLLLAAHQRLLVRKPQTAMRGATDYRPGRNAAKISRID